MEENKRLVQNGYNQMAEHYVVWSQQVRQSERAYYTQRLLDRLAQGAHVLELGCGGGVPTTQQLVQKFRVTGVDISEKMIEIARKNVQGATFLVADMTHLDFPPETFDGVAAFYSITHVPREEHPALLMRIFDLLKAGGTFIATMGQHESDDVDDEWLGVPMYFSHWDGATNRRLVQDAGFAIVDAREETSEEDGVEITFLWIVAEKPTPD